MVPGVYEVPNPPNAGGRSTMVFCRSGFVEEKTFLRKPMHQQDVGRNPLNSVGCRPVVFGWSKFSNLLALVRAYSQVLKKHPGQRICKERFRDSAQHWLMLDPSFILAFLGVCVKLAALHQQPKNLPRTRFEVSGKLQLFQLSTCALCSVLVIDMNWLAAWTAR